MNGQNVHQFMSGKRDLYYQVYMIYYCRWKMTADPLSNEPGSEATLLLEGMILEEGQILETLPQATRRALASTFLLWNVKLKWLMPDHQLGWLRTRGLQIFYIRLVL